MDKAEARRLLHDALSPYRDRPYSELTRLIEDSVLTEARGDSGTTYQIKVYAFWDDRPRGNLRVCGNIDDGGWRAFVPLGEDFIISPEGRFVGE